MAMCCAVIQCISIWQQNDSRFYSFDAVTICSVRNSFYKVQTFHKYIAKRTHKHLNQNTSYYEDA